MISFPSSAHECLSNSTPQVHNCSWIWGRIYPHIRKASMRYSKRHSSTLVILVQSVHIDRQHSQLPHRQMTKIISGKTSESAASHRDLCSLPARSAATSLARRRWSRLLRATTGAGASWFWCRRLPVDNYLLGVWEMLLQEFLLSFHLWFVDDKIPYQQHVIGPPFWKVIKQRTRSDRKTGFGYRGMTETLFIRMVVYVILWQHLSTFAKHIII